MNKSKKKCNKIYLLFLSLILLILFIESSSATTLSINNKNPNNEENSTLVLEDFIEKIEIKGDDAYVKDLIKFRINKNDLNETFYFQLSLPHINGINLTSSSFVVASCSFKQINENSIVWIFDIENKNWGLSCKERPKMTIYKKPKTTFIYEINLSKVNWSREEENQETRRIYLQMEYNINDFVIENEGEYKFLRIENLFSNHRTFKSNANMVHTYLILPSKNSILINPDNFEPNAFDSEGRLGLLYWNSEENSFITYRDAEEENKKRTKRDFLLILITLGFSILVGLLTTISSSERTKTLLLIFALFLVVSFYFLLIKDASLIFFIITLFILGFIGFLIILSLKKDKRFGWLKRFYKNIGDLFRKNPKKKSRRK